MAPMSLGLWLQIAALLLVYHVTRWLVRLVALLALPAVLKSFVKGGMRNG